MADEPKHENDVEPEEAEEQDAELLPKREVMSVLRPPIATIGPEPDVLPAPPLPEDIE